VVKAVVVDGGSIERALLEEIARRMVARKCELIEVLRGKVDNPAAAVEAATKRLNSQGLITYVMPMGGDCYAITQKGMQDLRTGENRG
jgi:DNA-binding PadR family transcriptional regulator